MTDSNRRHYDVAIIGAGTAGLSARREVAKHTDNYIVIDDGPLGTTCARVGCMPSKVLIEAANRFAARQDLAKLGIKGGQDLVIDRAVVMKHVRSLRDRFVRGVTGDMASWQQTHLLRERAQFVDHKTLRVGHQTITADSIVIATGSSPLVPGGWQEHSSYLMTTDDFFEQENLPGKVAVIGLGVIGLELGQALHRLGVETYGIGLGKAMGGLSDPELQDYTVNAFAGEFPVVTTGVEKLTKRNGKLVVHTEEQEYEVDQALLAMGRRPNLGGLGLENAVPSFDGRTIPGLDKGTHQIEGTRIFVAGDVNGERPILHEAADEGRIAGYNAVRETSQCFQRRTLLAITFCDPNIAVVGQSHRQLTDSKTPFVTGKVSYEGQGRAIVKLKEKGALHVYGHQKTGKLLGAELFAPDGEHLAHLIAWAIQADMTVFQTLALPFYHPVVEEGLRTALRDAARQVDSDQPPLEVLRCQDAPVW